MDAIVPGQFSDAEDDDFMFETNQVQTQRGEKRKNESDEAESISDVEDDDLIRNINEDEVLAQIGRGEKWKNESDEAESISDVEDDDLILNINEDEVLAQIGRGEKRKNESDEEAESEDEQGQYYYQLESRRKYHSKKFGMTATGSTMYLPTAISSKVTRVASKFSIIY